MAEESDPGLDRHPVLEDVALVPGSEHRDYNQAERQLLENVGIQDRSRSPHELTPLDGFSRVALGTIAAKEHSNTSNEPSPSIRSPEISLMPSAMMDVLAGRESPPDLEWFVDNFDRIEKMDLVMALNMAADFVLDRTRSHNGAQSAAYHFVYFAVPEMCQSSQALRDLPNTVLIQLVVMAFRAVVILGSKHGFSTDY
jgi:hypothetical protein